MSLNFFGVIMLINSSHEAYSKIILNAQQHEENIHIIRFLQNLIFLMNMHLYGYHGNT